MNEESPRQKRDRTSSQRQFIGTFQVCGSEITSSASDKRRNLTLQGRAEGLTTSALAEDATLQAFCT